MCGWFPRRTNDILAMMAIHWQGEATWALRLGEVGEVA